MWSHPMTALTSALFLFSWLVVARKNIIVDTDIFSDCDDAAALLLTASSPDVRLLAVNVNSQSTYGSLATSAILAHYHHPCTPIGARRPFTNDTFHDTWVYELGEFASKVAYHWSGGSLPWGQADSAWDPVTLYRKMLSASEDGSVTILSLGFFENLAGLLDSPADSYSELSGRDLISAKVSEMVVMGGAYPSGQEFNFAGDDPEAAARVINNWPGRMVFIGFELGLEVLTGEPLMTAGPASDPVRGAYIYYTYGKASYSWDSLAALYAIRGLGDLFEYANEDGYNRVNPEDGSNEWVSDSSVTNQHYLLLKADNNTVAAELDRLYLDAALAADNPDKAVDIPRVQRRLHTILPKADL